MSDVISAAPARVITWVAIDQHKLSLVAATLPASGGAPEVVRLENTERAIRRFIDALGDPEGLAVAYEAGPGGYELHRFLTGMGVACDVIAPSLTPIRAGDRVKTDRRDAKKLVRLYRAGELSFVAPPSPAQEGLRDLVRARDDLRCARTASSHPGLSSNSPARCMREGERRLAEQVEASYARAVSDWQAAAPKKVGASVTPGRALQRPSKGKVTRQTTSP